MKKLITVMLIFGWVTSFAQVPTRMFEKNKAFEKHPDFQISRKNAPEKNMPVFDVAPLLEEDKAIEGMDFPFRFGKSFDVNLSLKDGKWVKTDSAEVWSLKISSPKAYSLNFIFSELYLPKGAELYIFNADGSMVYGPVTDKQNQHGKTYLSDVIQGETILMQLSVPITSAEKPKLTIQNVIHGYKNIFLDIGYGESGSCNPDVACYFPEWEDEADGVVQILLSDGTEWCSGSLLNNTNQDFRPYILTAFHCIDLDENGVLSAGEITDAEDWLVRFRFRRTTCDGNTIANVITYDDTQFRAAWNTTDFALVELQDNIINDIYSVGQKVWLGWDRTGNTPSHGTYIHHPSGDVAKYAYDADQLLETDYGGTSSGQNYWYSHLNGNNDIGTFEPGSSGSPVFDQNSRVVGQLRGGNPGCSSSKQFWHGCLYRSWTGGGTNDTRLSNWLEPTGTATTLNSIRQPTPTYSGIGDVLCSNSYFSITNLAPGYSVDHWTGNNVTFPNGNTGNPVLVSPGSPGEAWVQAIINTGGGQYTMDQGHFITGSPSPGPITIQMDSPYHRFTASIDDVPTANSYNWYLDGALNTTYHGTSAIFNRVSPYCGNWYGVEVEEINDCGTSAKTSGLAVEPDCLYLLQLTPNPTGTESTAELVSEAGSDIDPNVAWVLEVYDSGQALKEKQSGLKGKSTKLNTTNWKEGVYIIRANYNGNVLTNKLVVKH